jgi:putative FmdB family regulatory protein
MPIFEYLCEDCGNKFEKLVRRPGADQVLCPSCGQSHLEQQFSAFAAHSARDPFTTSSAGSGAAPTCPSGMCSTPGLCGRSDN